MSGCSSCTIRQYDVNADVRIACYAHRKVQPPQEPKNSTAIRLSAVKVTDRNN